MSEWTRDFFREPIFSPGVAEAEAHAAAEASFLVKVLRLKKGARVLDICCGTGRHARRLARRGINVTAVDATPAYLAQARRHARGLKTLRLARGDMRRLPFHSEFDAAYNVWTSFGYFADARDDLKALCAAARALKPGGLFLIDVLDHSWLKKNFKARDWARRANGSYCLEETALSAGADPTVVSRWTILRARREPVTARSSVRCYDERRLTALLRRAGLATLRRFRSLDGTRSGPRLVLLARRPV